ncbi:galactose oxidase [Ascobolus immersus RN42]|uniref:Galactose oxidase n=1 Tax=Ascobolus immersus RN42 TaxID=1160509 RepID=A0A3N4HMX1_ASCIM|nr:galactose oxidase [Ascobolus immersus RN42]
MAKKKAKSAELKARKAEKATKKSQKKSSKTAADSDAEDIDLDAVLAEYAAQQANFHKVAETPLADPPSARTNSTLTPSPTNSNELFLFGGESFNGALAHFYNDLFVHIIDKNEWRHITSPNSPLPRSGHAAVTGKKEIWLFGGEFSSPKQGTFYHYGDFWRLDTANREWTKVEGKKGATPPARSGHRLVCWKQYVILYGGFQDLSASTKYMNDLWVFDTVEYTWTNVGNLMPSHAQKPEARSGFSFLPHENGAVLFGGYSRVKGTTAVSKSAQKGTKKSGGGGGGGATRNVLKPMFHTDCWFLRMSTDLKAVRWERRKKPVNAPNPPRAGVSMAYHKGRGIMFGGVHDVEESEEAIDSQFFNDFFAWAVDRNRFFALQMRRPKQNQGKKSGGGGGRRGRAQDAEEELLENLRRLQAGGPTEEEMDELAPVKKEEEVVKVVKENSFQLPAPRFDAALAVQDDVLYIYGGRFESGDKEDREVTFDEMFAIDLGKLDGVREVFSRGTTKDWEVEEEEEDDEDDEDDDDEDEDEEEEPEIDEEEEERRRKAREERKSKKKSKDGEVPAPVEVVTEPVVEEEGPETDEPIDTTPHPRPFETLREFFSRTSNAWQDHLLAILTEQGKAENLGVKEIRKKAFEMAEEKWWACREEIREMEDEQEAHGIGEVVNLEEKNAAGGGGGRARR